MITTALIGIYAIKTYNIEGYNMVRPEGIGEVVYFTSGQAYPNTYNPQ